MIDKTEEDIMKNWKGDLNKPLVSIRCTAYNHEKYIEQCLDGFLIQETNFPFEAIVHDDSSTDKTAEIIKKYEKKYPHIIKPIYEIENQYSKGGDSLSNAINPYLKGKYVAFCEGDDFWTDKNKLQLQVEFMEIHPECSMCVHNTIIHDLSKHKKDRKFNEWSKIKFLNEYDVFMGWYVHTTSYFIKREYEILSNWMQKYWFGDFVILTYAFSKGKIGYLPQTMSVYNYNNQSGITYKNKQEKLGNKEKERIEYLNKFNEFTDYKYNKIITERIDQINFSMEIIEHLYNYKYKCQDKNELKEIKKSSYYNKYVSLLSNKDRVKNFIKLDLVKFKPLRKIILNKINV